MRQQGATPGSPPHFNTKLDILVDCRLSAVDGGHAAALAVAGGPVVCMWPSGYVSVRVRSASISRVQPPSWTLR